MFIRELAGATGLPLKDADRVYDEFIRITVEHLRAGDQVTLTGFGKFTWKWMKGRPANIAPGRKHEPPEDYPSVQFRGTPVVNRFVASPGDLGEGRRVPGTRLLTDGSRALQAADGDDD
nr:HU family DNA-binding protein [Microbacterium esteraromaticum]